MAEPAVSKSEIVARIEAGRAELFWFIEGMDETTLLTPDPAGWSPKDHLAHLAMWERSLAALLSRRDRWAAMGISGVTAGDEDVDRINDALFQSAREHPLPDVLAMLDEAHAEVLAGLRKLSQSDLARPYVDFVPGAPDEEEPSSVVEWIAGNTWEHYAEHIGWMAGR